MHSGHCVGCSRMSAVDISTLQRWIGRTETRTGVLAAAPVAALSATLNYTQPRARIGDALPPCWHWMYFQDAVVASALGVDGHGERGDFLPPVSLPRRMWAGSRLRFLAPLIVGQTVRRVSTIATVTPKPGRTEKSVTAADAFALGRGSVRDCAHVLIAAARAVGYPARLVSGHCLDGPNAASHR